MGAEIILFRIDQRLLHGQGQVWLRYSGANSVIVANDKAATDKVQQSLMSSMIEKSIAVSYYDIEKLIKIFDKANPKQKFFMVVGSTEDALKLVEGGIPIKEINIGNIHDAEGKTKVTRSIYLSEKEKDDLRKLRDLGCSFNTRTTPTGGDGAKEADINDYI